MLRWPVFLKLMLADVSQTSETHLCSSTDRQVILDGGALRTWWEIKPFPVDYLRLSAERLLLNFRKMFTSHYPQISKQAEAAFEMYPTAERFRMIISQGMRFALLEWSNPNMQKDPDPSPWGWVNDQEKVTSAALDASRKQLEKNVLFRRGYSLVYDPHSYTAKLKPPVGQMNSLCVPQDKSSHK